MKAKIFIAVFAICLAGAFVLTTCSDAEWGSSLHGSVSSYTAEDTVIYCQKDLFGANRGAKIGEITGAITLTDVPSKLPRMSIMVFGHDDGYHNYYYSFSRPIKLSDSGDFTNIPWSIPVYENDGFFPLDGEFSLFVEYTSGESISFDTPAAPYISSANANVGNLGAVSLKTITLSGTISVNCNGQKLPKVFIMVGCPGGNSQVRLDSPAENTSWSFRIPSSNFSFQSEIWVDGYSDDGSWFFDNRDNIISVHNTDISGITLNLGNIDKK